MGDAKPIKERFYRVNADKRKCLDAEVNHMLENGNAEHTERERFSTPFSCTPLLIIGSGYD